MMNCTEFQRRNYSLTMLNQAMNKDSGSWWWWINCLGTLCFGTIGLIGNIICFLVVCRFSLNQHSYVEYLRALAIFDLISLLFEFVHSLNELTSYLFAIHLFKLSYSSVCKSYEYLRHAVILLACWTIVSLTFDRLILVCDPWSKKWPNFSRRICNCPCAKRILLFLILLSLLINIPHLFSQEWVCRLDGYQHSAAFLAGHSFNRTRLNASLQTICQCRISPRLKKKTLTFLIRWNIYVYHLLSYTLLPAIILIASNAAILKLVHTPRQIVGQQNEHLRSKLTRTLTSVSIMFLILYFPHALIEQISIYLVPIYQNRCDVKSLIRIRILKRLCELLNIIALSANFFIYILGVHHYRSSAIQMLGLHHFQVFVPYLTAEHRNSIGSIAFLSQRRNTQTDSSSIKLIKVINPPSQNLNQSPNLPRMNQRLSK